MLNMRVNPQSVKQIQALIDKVDTYPNRIASMQQSALLRSQRQIVDVVSRNHKAAKYLNFKIDPIGILNYKMTIKPADISDVNAYYASVILLGGRRGGKIIRARNANLMKLRPESVAAGYPKFLETAELGAIPSRRETVKFESRELIIKNIKYAAARFGFGPRGGAPSGLGDLPTVRSRAK